MIRYLKNKEIDKSLWDQCISKADFPMTDNMSWYLDIVTPGWSALVLDDYRVIMPLPVRQKLGITYIYRPLFVQQLGLSGKSTSQELVTDFINAIPAKIKLADIFLNESNPLPPGKYESKENKNFILDIRKTYEEIEKEYNRNCRRNIKKAVSAGLRFSSSISFNDFTGLLEEQIRDQKGSFRKKERIQFRALLSEILNREAGELVGIQNEQGDLQAAGFYVFSFDRLLFKICGSNSEGKENQAMYMLIDEQLKRHAGKFNWYDFQGSNIEGIAYFNSTFGALPETYYYLRINRLPNVLKVLTGKK